MAKPIDFDEIPLEGWIEIQRRLFELEREHGFEFRYQNQDDLEFSKYLKQALEDSGFSDIVPAGDKYSIRSTQTSETTYGKIFFLFIPECGYEAPKRKLMRLLGELTVSRAMNQFPSVLRKFFQDRKCGIHVEEEMHRLLITQINAKFFLSLPMVIKDYILSRSEFSLKYFVNCLKSDYRFSDRADRLNVLKYQYQNHRGKFIEQMTDVFSINQYNLSEEGRVFIGTVFVENYSVFFYDKNLLSLLQENFEYVLTILCYMKPTEEVGRFIEAFLRSNQSLSAKMARKLFFNIPIGIENSIASIFLLDFIREKSNHFLLRMYYKIFPSMTQKIWKRLRDQHWYFSPDVSFHAFNLRALFPLLMNFIEQGEIKKGTIFNKYPQSKLLEWFLIRVKMLYSPECERGFQNQEIDEAWIRKNVEMTRGIIQALISGGLDVSSAVSAVFNKREPRQIISAIQAQDVIRLLMAVERYCSSLEEKSVVEPPPPPIFVSNKSNFCDTSPMVDVALFPRSRISMV